MKRSKFQNPKLKLTKGKNPRWHIRYYDADGKPDREYFGPVATVTREEARKAAREFIDRVNNPRPRSLEFDGTLKAFFEQYYVPAKLSESNPAVKETTRKQYLMIWKNYIEPGLGHFKLRDILVPDVEEWLRGLAEKGHSRVSRTAYRAVLNNIFVKAINNRFIGYNPSQCAELGTKGKKTRTKVFLEPAQIRALMERLPRHVQMMIKLSLRTGLRISEMLALRWKNVDLINGTFVVEERWCRGVMDTPKNESAEKAHTLGEMTQEMRMWRADNPDAVFVFQSSRGALPCSYAEVQRKLRLAARAIDVYKPGFGWHTFRRVCVTLGTRITSAEETAKRVGKSSAKTINPYLLLNKERDEEIGDKIMQKALGEVQ